MSTTALSRRSFMQMAGAAGLAGVLPASAEGFVPRPPGAGHDFLARCIRCGLCVEACPYDSILMLGIGAGARVHTPWVDPLDTPCYLCQQRGADGKDRPVSRYLRCGEVCPTGALTRIVNDKQVLAEVPLELKMGTSVLARELCLAWEYDSCGECYYNCPLKDSALLSSPPGETFADATGIRPWVDSDHCIGCGMCNYVCPVNEKVARAVMRRDIKLSLFEERYAAMVRNLMGKVGPDVKLPAIRVEPARSRSTHTGPS